MKTCALFAPIVSTYPHLENLTFLHVGVDDPAFHYVASILHHSINLVTLVLMNGQDAPSDPEELRPFIKAVASLSSLETLNGDNIAFLMDVRISTEWTCPLTRLKITDGEYPLFINYTTVRKFLSHFSSTLLHFEITTPFKSWIDPLSHSSSSTPFLQTPSIPLPHLITLGLYSEFGASYLSQVPMHFFRDSPIESLILSSLMNWDRVESLSEVLVPFMRARKETLKVLELNWNSLERKGGEEMAARAEEMGIELVDCTASCGMDDEPMWSEEGEEE